jgi:hypothetical protein
MRKRALAEKVADLEDRVEGLEELLAELTQNGRLVVQMERDRPQHSNGRGLSPLGAEQLREAAARKAPG